jgi:hypothetical protein
MLCIELLWQGPWFSVSFSLRFRLSGVSISSSFTFQLTEEMTPDELFRAFFGGQFGTVMMVMMGMMMMMVYVRGDSYT